MENLIYRSFFVFNVVFFSFLFFYPNIAVQDLQIVFKDYYRDENGKKIPVQDDLIQDFISDRENGLRAYFGHAKCIPEESGKFSASRRCVLSKRFITSAKVNEIVQNHPDLVDEYFTKILPNPIEKFFSFMVQSGPEDERFKNLNIKLGLDLQGGMRATFRADFDTYLEKMNEKYIPVLNELKKTVADQSIDISERNAAKSRLDNIEEILDLNDEGKERLLDEAKRIIDKRLASQNLTEPEVRVQPASYSISVDMPGAANSSDVLSKIKDTVTVEYRLVNDEATERLNSQFQIELEEIRKIYRSEKPDLHDAEEILKHVEKKAGLSAADGKIFLLWRRGRKMGTSILPREFRVLGPAVLDGSDITDARENPSPDSGWYAINFQLSGAGADKFGEVTTNNIGRRLAILWGDRVVSDPRINTPIVQGSGVITGDFTRDDAAEVANVIREGALPLPLEILSVNFVGPSLGQESISAGVISVVIGFFLVVLFMMGYYRWFGFLAVFVLFLNLLIMSSILSLLEFTLTLPGFAGIILTVGMAVDANVIIYEKIKEDLREGRVMAVAIASGFESSFWTILDSNITSLIAAVILFYNGDGPIKGFAITLFFGLLTSMFTSLFVSRLVLDWLMQFFDLSRMKPGWNIKGSAA
ncbi:MAG: protein translocase subunit SecD [Spirochaetia bacterium]|nr:protein translocase subunit SecD [Spirochaetia bacterium]